MQSKLNRSSSRKSIRRSLHGGEQSISREEVSDPAPSDPIGGHGDIAMSTVGVSLSLIIEASALVSAAPYIGPIAKIILQALTMRNEVKQLKEEWEAVMQRLEQVGRLVVRVGKWCQDRNMNQEDLPSEFRDVFGTLQKDLDGIQDALKECIEVKGIKKVLKRTDILGRVKKYDAKLTYTLQLFNTDMTLISLLNQINCASEHKVTSLGLTTPGLIPLAEPFLSRPQLFFGRDAELAQILEMVLKRNQPHPAHIAILGPGGYGKTTLANAVLTHPSIQEHFQNLRYMVSCDSLSSSGAFLIELAKTLGVSNISSEDLWPYIHASLIKKECILCLDNFESLWDQPSDIKISIEHILSQITELPCVTVIITMRGTEKPGGTYWTQPTLSPLQTLHQGAAQDIWKCIAENYDDYAAKLIMAVDNVPLAVSLLAHISQTTTPAFLWEEWNKKKTRLVQRGQHRLLSLEFSIQLSIDSERMRCNPEAKDLLGILSMLPEGIHEDGLHKFQKLLKDINILSGCQVLQQCALIHVAGKRHQTYPIIRDVCNSLNFLSFQYKSLIQDLYISLALLNPYEASAEDYAEMMLEVNNTKAILLDLLKSSHQHQPRLFDAIVTFTQFCITIGDYSDSLTTHAVKLLQQQQDSTQTPVLIKCLQNWGRLYYRKNDFENAKSQMKQAERHCLSSLSNETSLHASILRNLGDIYVKQGVLSEAEAAYEKALKYNQASSHSDQGNDYTKLGEMYVGLNRLEEAEALYKRALEVHEPANNILGQGNASLGLGNVQLRLNKLNEAEAKFHNALSLHKAANSIRSQGNDYIGLGNTYLKLKKLDQAKYSFEEALKLHKDANSVRGQANDFCGLGETYLKQNKLDEAEVSFTKALKLHKIANSAQGQSYANTGLKRVHQYRTRS